ncbi:MAG: class I SAM-dependent methyltransferase, partial [Candidatus Omnitrophica bacterium]|nr:class I SAM-dependent methyltransferase [Candidatus Omnitrophota bacterium]
YKDKFDAIYAFEVIEHVMNYDAFLRNLSGSLKEGGLLLLTTPNVLAPRNRINLLLGRDWWFASKYHIHYFSPRTLKLALENAGFLDISLKSGGITSFLGPNFGGSLFAVARKI